MLDPDFLLLDEPAAGLSGDEIERLGLLIKAISRRGTAVLLVEHHADLIFEICDQVTVLNLGRVLAAGTPAEIRVHKEVVSAISASEALLAVSSLQAGYGKIRVLHGVDLAVARGEVVALLVQTAPARPPPARALGIAAGDRGTSAVRWPRHHRHHAARGRTRRPRARHRGPSVFTQISVTDNLLLAGYDLPRGERAARVEEALSFFPEIAAKRHERGGALSGGQQQMLTVAQVWCAGRAS